MTLNTALVIVMLLALTPWLGLVSSPLVVLTIPLALVTGLIVAGTAIAFTSIARSLSQLSYFFSLFVLPMFWLSGAFFPTDDLPSWAATLAGMFPLFHAVEVSRALTTGEGLGAALDNVAWLAAATPAALWLGIWAMRRRIVSG